MGAMRVPLLDPSRANDALRDELRAAFDRVMASGKFILGEEVTAFERECAAYVGAKFAIGLSSGTDALLVALMALDIKPGDEVICPTYTFFATAGSIWRIGAKPVFVDSCPVCFNGDPHEVVRRLSSRTRAIMPVHLFGQCAELSALRDEAASRKVPIIEDAAQAIGAEYHGKRAGILGKLACFSFFPSKNLGGFGDGGLITTDDETLADRLRALRTHGGTKTYEHEWVGGNFRLDAMQAALLRVKLAHLETYTAKRQANAAMYDRLFLASGQAAPAPEKGCTAAAPAGRAAEAPIILPRREQSRHVFNQYVIRVPGGRRDHLKARLAERGIDTAIYYPKPLHLQRCFASLGHAAGAFPVAEQLAAETLALPIYSELRRDEITYVVEQAVEAVRQG